jgi:hypothetical protein
MEGEYEVTENKKDPYSFVISCLLFTALLDLGRFFCFLIHKQSVGLLGRYRVHKSPPCDNIFSPHSHTLLL